MAISTIIEFEEATAFERLTLDRLIPLYLSNSFTNEIDLREAMAGTGSILVKAAAFVSTSDDAIKKLRLDLLPLLFGAAWKVLDFVVELSICIHDPSQSTKEIRIQDKAKYASSGMLSPLAMNGDPTIWRALGKLYAATKEHRHCLVHRTLSFSETDLSLRGQDKLNHPLTPLSQAEIQAVIASAQIIANAIIHNELDGRSADYLRYELDCLQTHTQLPPLGGKRASVPETFIMKLSLRDDGLYELDLTLARSRAGLNQDIHYDLLIDIPGDLGRKIYGTLESVPDTHIILDLDNLPSYFSFR